MLNWLVNEHWIEPHIPVFDKSQHADGTFSRDELAYDPKRDCYICPAGNELRQRQKTYRLPRPLVDRNGMMRYRASKLDCQNCSLKPQCCPNAPARKIPRSIHEGARDMAREFAKTEAHRTSRRQRKKVEMLFAHLKRILKLDRLRFTTVGDASKKHDPAGTSTSTNVRPDETEVHAVSMACRTHCGFPQVRIQIRGIPFECFSTRPPASSSALGGLIHKLTNTL